MNPRRDEIDDLLNSPARTATPPASYQPQTFQDPCRRCNGSGRWMNTHRPCFTCSGRGTITRKTSPDARAHARSQKAARRAVEQERNWDTFKAANEAVAAWLDASTTFEFAVSLKQTVLRYGNLSEKQMAAALKCVAKRADNARRDAARVAEATPINMDALTAAFSRAGAALKRPALRFEGMKVYPARNKPGVLYVVATERDGEGERAYLGKVADGKFIRSRECTLDQQSRFTAAAVDPLGASILYGRLTGNCGCCGRALTDPESVARGIGPVCAEQFFGA